MLREERELGVAAERLIVFTGRLSPEKRADDLIRAYERLRSSFPDVALAVIGSGREEEKLRTLAGGNVIFPGVVDDTAPWLRAADVFVLPSDTEGMSNALLEAMACGLPCVASEVGAARDLVGEDEAGLLFEAGDEQALEAALARMLKDEAFAEAAGRAARKTAVDAFSLDSVADRLIAQYRELAGHG